MAIEALAGAVSGALGQLPIVTPEKIREYIHSFSRVPDFEASDEEKEQLAKDLESRLDVTMANGAVVQEEFKPWLADARRDIEPYYWDRYRQLVGEKGFPPKVVAKLDDVTDRVLGLLENPNKAGQWDRRGMVVGHVQSGKTANYTGLICKAADAGYRLIIVIAGLHNNLRNQTQERIEEGFVGWNGANQKDVGVSRFGKVRRPVTGTDRYRDFNRTTAETMLGVSLRSLNVPAVLVIKKNTHTLGNVISWLKAHNVSGSRVMDAPMLLIDDEADNASIDISKAPDQASRINSQIRQLLNLFDKKCYVGYTATPFANIFIDPETNDEMLKADLFPEDFIVTLDPPTNYFGPTRIFSDNPEFDVVREIVDNEDVLPVKHRKDHDVVELPASLMEAIRTFVLARAIRLLRGQTGVHNSMLVNASRFTDVQHQLRDVIHDYLRKLERRIRFEAGKPVTEALRDDMISEMHTTWQTEYQGLEFEWDAIQGILLESIAPIQVVEVNSSKSATGLNYREHDESGLNAIAVGGFSLSRGLTLEGLLVSYFLRNSMMYDTLMQMGRWFGYRPGHEDICRMWMSPEAVGWYAHITDSMEELRDQMREMERAKLTPKDFGLKIRSHPDALIVTARNKMRSAEKVSVRVGLNNEFIETHTVWRESSRLNSNRQAFADLVQQMGGRSAADENLRKYRLNWFWSDVPVSHILDFLNAYQNHPLSPLSDPKPVSRYIEDRVDDELPRWDVVLVNRGDPNAPKPDDTVDSGMFGFPVVMQKRTAGTRTNAEFIQIGSRQRVASRPIEDIGLDPKLIEEAQAEFFSDPANTGRNPPDRIYRRKRKKPLLILHLLKVVQDESVVSLGVPAWGISFPESSRDDPTVEYVVNTTWWREHFGEERDEDMEGDDGA